MRLPVKTLILAALALSTALFAASTAAATTKQTTIFPLDFSSVIPAGDLCAFPVALEQGPGLIKIDDFYAADGHLVKEIITNYGGVFRETFSANGVTVSTVQTFSDIVTFNADGSLAGVSDSGINSVITIPHQGAVYLQVGRIVYDSNFNPVFTAGPGFATQPDNAALCAALSGS